MRPAIAGTTSNRRRPATADASDAEQGHLTRVEALELLGVKAATLYTYVSRGLIRRVSTPGRKQSFYYREDIDRVRARGSARATDAALAAGAIRYGEPIVPTSITEITPHGPKYRSRNAIDLARAGLRFEAVAELLWTGMLLEHRAWAVEPVSEQFARMADQPGRLASPVALHDAFSFVTLASAMDRGNPLSRVAESASPVLAARQLILILTGCFGFLGNARRYRAPKAGETVAVAIATSLALSTSRDTTRALDAALILCADHELNPATFVARIGASSESDLYSCIASAILANSGARIARACDRLEQLLRVPGAIGRMGSDAGAASADADLSKLGFNHPLYQRGDPRGQCLLQIVRELKPGSSRVRRILDDIDKAREERGQFARLETALAVLSIALEMPAGAAAGIYTLARIAGWVAHIAEQRLYGFLIRPRAKFVAAAH